MTNKNPYENQDTVDIPDFVEKDDVNKVKFNMNDNEDYDDEDEYDDDYEEKPRKPKNKVLLLGAIIVGILVLIVIALLIFGISKSNKLKTLQAQYDAYVSDATTKINEYEVKIKDLNAQIEELKNPTTPVTPGGDVPVSATYKIVVDAINMRTGPSKSDTIFGQFDKGDTCVVSEITTDANGAYWGKTTYEGKEVWFCISDGTNTYAEIVTQ